MISIEDRDGTEYVINPRHMESATIKCVAGSEYADEGADEGDSVWQVLIHLHSGRTIQILVCGDEGYSDARTAIAHAEQ
jgi:hypothetical protein